MHKSKNNIIKEWLVQNGNPEIQRQVEEEARNLHNLKNTNFELTINQENQLKEWQEKIKEVFGKYGHYDYTFTPFGMVTGCKVRSHLTKTTIDLTEY